MKKIFSKVLQHKKWLMIVAIICWFLFGLLGEIWTPAKVIQWFSAVIAGFLAAIIWNEVKNHEKKED